MPPGFTRRDRSGAGLRAQLIYRGEAEIARPARPDLRPCRLVMFPAPPVGEGGSTLWMNARTRSASNTRELARRLAHAGARHDPMSPAPRRRPNRPVRLSRFVTDRQCPYAPRADMLAQAAADSAA